MEQRSNTGRLAELRRLMILDTQPERAFDDVTRMLSETLRAPITMVNLLDEKRDWFKSCVGMPQTESPAATSFCAAFLGSDEPVIVVEDTTRDDRFSAHPFVVGPPFIRFYAAARLRVNGQTIGTLCAYDLEPRTIDASEVENLQVLASAVVELLVRRAS
jgi:GAF domain-containing protein